MWQLRQEVGEILSNSDKEQEAVYALRRALFERVVEWDKGAKEFDEDTKAFIIEAGIAEFFANFLRNAMVDAKERAKFLALVDRLANESEQEPPRSKH
jgi:predicted transcriptional regulator